MDQMEKKVTMDQTIKGPQTMRISFYGPATKPKINGLDTGMQKFKVQTHTQKNTKVERR